MDYLSDLHKTQMRPVLFSPILEVRKLTHTLGLVMCSRVTGLACQRISFW